MSTSCRHCTGLCEQLSDAMSIILQTAARRSDSKVYPFPFAGDKKNTKALNQLLRRNMVKRVLVSGIAPYHKQVRNVGCVNYEITADGYDAIHW